MSSIFLWLGLTLILAVPLVLPAVRVVELVGAVLMIIGVVLLILGR